VKLLQILDVVFLEREVVEENNKEKMAHLSFFGCILLLYLKNSLVVKL